jgi:hypothetical protein
MSMAFRRSQRALADDRQRMPLALLLVALIVLAAWAAWFLLAHVPVYADCGVGVVTPDRLALVRCSPDALARIHLGQAAGLIVQRPGMPARQLPAVVRDIPNPFQRLAEWGMVKLYVYPTSDSVVGMSGYTRIEVDQLSPATLMMQMTNRVAGDG